MEKGQSQSGCFTFLLLFFFSQRRKVRPLFFSQSGTKKLWEINSSASVYDPEYFTGCGERRVRVGALNITNANLCYVSPANKNCL